MLELEVVRCGRCGRPLLDPGTRALGFGATCWGLLTPDERAGVSPIRQARAFGDGRRLSLRGVGGPPSIDERERITASVRARAGRLF
jgi:hypothetical protein